jgi:hypothetical protein
MPVLKGRKTSPFITDSQLTRGQSRAVLHCPHSSSAVEMYAYTLAPIVQARCDQSRKSAEFECVGLMIISGGTAKLILEPKAVDGDP